MVLIGGAIPYVSVCVGRETIVGHDQDAVSIEKLERRLVPCLGMLRRGYGLERRLRRGVLWVNYVILLDVYISLEIGAMICEVCGL
jgi:hypothetical protein